LQPLSQARRQGGQLALNLFRQVVPIDDHGGAQAEQDAVFFRGLIGRPIAALPARPLL
jgi:hypothetical protein